MEKGSIKNLQKELLNFLNNAPKEEQCSNLENEMLADMKNLYDSIENFLMDRDMGFKRNIILGNTKYKFIEYYRNFKIYQEYGTTLFVAQSYAIINDKEDIKIVSSSYNHLDKDDIKDLIDYYVKNKEFGVKAICNDGVYHIHDSGKRI